MYKHDYVREIKLRCSELHDVEQTKLLNKIHR